jgi:anti-sigma B factor antagonist
VRAVQGILAGVETGQIVLEEDSGVGVVVVQGEHDLNTAPALSEQLSELIGSGSPIAVDLTPATFIDSSILKVMLDGRRQAADMGLGFAVAAGESSAEGVRRVLDVTGLKSTLPVLSSRQEAVAAAKKGEQA